MYRIFRGYFSVEWWSDWPKDQKKNRLGAEKDCAHFEPYFGLFVHKLYDFRSLIKFFLLHYTFLTIICKIFCKTSAFRSSSLFSVKNFFGILNIRTYVFQPYVIWYWLTIIKWSDEPLFGNLFSNKWSKRESDTLIGPFHLFESKTTDYQQIIIQ